MLDMGVYCCEMTDLWGYVVCCDVLAQASVYLTRASGCLDFIVYSGSGACSCLKLGVLPVISMLGALNFLDLVLVVGGLCCNDCSISDWCSGCL